MSARLFYGYSPYGEQTQVGTNDANSLQYTGRENDNTGLYFYRTRYYDPGLKRFISEDPLGLVGGGDVYAYVAGDPLTYRDPQGRELAAGIVGGAIGAIWGGINGYLEGDRGSTLLIDALSGAATGGLAGLTNGLSLTEGLAGRAVLSSIFEADRQVANGAIRGCIKINKTQIALAGVASIFGDLAGTATTEQQALRATERLHYNVPSVDTVFSTVVGGNASGAIETPYSAMQGAGSR